MPSNQASSVVVPLVVAVIGASTALLIAYWHRKQMRQIEAHKLDQSVGLMPPPSAAWQFFGKHWYLGFCIICTIWNLRRLAIDLNSTLPLTRGDVLSIASSFSATLVIWLSYLAITIIEFLRGIVNSLLDVQQRHFALTNELNSASGTHLEVTKELVRRDKEHFAITGKIANAIAEKTESEEQ